MTNVIERKEPSSLQQDNKNVKVINNYINGKFVEPVQGKYLDKINPATNQLLAHVAASTSDDINNAVQAAKQAFPSWSALDRQERGALLQKVANRIRDKLTYLAQLESEDTGKPIRISSAIDIPRAVQNFEFFIHAIEQIEDDYHYTRDYENKTYRSPIGIAGLITPWNLPLYLLTWKVAPALIMGNCVVAKPSEITPQTAYELANIMNEVGIPNGVFNVVNGFGHEAGQSLVEHKDVEIISFTGGTVTGRRVASTAAPLFKKLSLELGGKNASVVFDDCDFDNAVNGVWRAAFTNQGQVCLCGSRIFIQQSIYDKFVQALVDKSKAVLSKIGNPLDINTEFGSVTSHQHLTQKVMYYVDLARQHPSAQILCGGKQPNDKLPAPYNEGAFYEPTIIEGLPVDHRCAVEEIFGPVVTVHPFKDEQDVTRMVNLTNYGLAGSIWTNNLSAATRLSKSWITGMVWINCWLHRDLRVPFGGVRESGTGVEGGKYSLEFYSNTKNICTYVPPLK